MKFTRYSLSFVALMMIAFAVQAQTHRLGVINIERIIKESAPAVRAAQKLESEFTAREKEINDASDKLVGMKAKLERDAAVMSDTDKQKMRREMQDLEREINRKREEFREDLNSRRNEELSSLLDKINRITKEIGKKNNFDMIFQENVVYFDPKLDITEQVLKALADAK